LWKSLFSELAVLFDSLTSNYATSFATVLLDELTGAME